MIIDTHAHLNFNAFSKDRHKVIEKSLTDKVWMINVGSNYDTSKKAVCLAEKYKAGVYAAVGLHPIHARQGWQYKKYKALAQSKKVVAIGETGLDFKKEYSGFIEQQKQVFLNQLNLAQELDLPIIFHCRMAHQAMLKMLEERLKNKKYKIKGVIHCFTGNWQQAEKYLSMGFYLGFNGIIFKLNLSNIIKKVPTDKILIETDCPYLTPAPFSGRNQPLYVKQVLEKIADIKSKRWQSLARQTTLNAKKLFKIK